jgi:hypothetical protein
VRFGAAVLTAGPADVARRRRFVALAGLLGLLTATAFLSACGDDEGATEGPADTGAAADGADAPLGADPVPAAGDDSIAVVVEDGPDAGEYAEPEATANCTLGQVEEGTFAVEFSEPAAAQLTVLQVTVPDAAAAGEGTDAFQASLSVGDITYQVESGTASVDVDSDAPLLVVEGSAADGTGITIEVDCGLVERP